MSYVAAPRMCKCLANDDLTFRAEIVLACRPKFHRGVVIDNRHKIAKRCVHLNIWMTVVHTTAAIGTPSLSTDEYAIVLTFFLIV